MIKEPDFATSLASVHQNLERCWKEEQQGRLAVADCEAYEPTLGQPSAFVGSAIVKDGQKIGVLTLQLSSGVL
jgi:hypothetical protein